MDGIVVQIIGKPLIRIMDKNFITADFIGRCIDTIIPFVIGIIGLVYSPRRIAKEVESRKRTEVEGKQLLKRLKIACYLIMLLGVFKLIEFF
jgi:hypothetical protein